MNAIVGQGMADTGATTTAHAQPGRTLSGRLPPLIGRDREIAAAITLLTREATTLLTLTGPGGVGKTRLALQIAATLDATVPELDANVVVPLAAIRDPDLVLPTIAGALGVRDAGRQPPLSAIAAQLGTRRALLVLDNLEQVLNAAPALAALLDTCAGLTILATSRAPLRIGGEREFPVAPLAAPDPATLSDGDTLLAHPATRLFVERARAARPDFTPSLDEARAIATICARLDGLPLAIELAAARSKLLPPRALLARLERRLPLLTGGAADLPARQRTLRDTIAWSYDLLAPAEQTLFRRLAVFAAGCPLDAAEALAGGRWAVDSPPSTDTTDTLDTLASLVDKNLLVQEGEPDGSPRLRMLELVREYGLELLASTGEEGEARRAHAAYFVALGAAALPALSGPEQERWLAQLEREHDNLRAALATLRDFGLRDEALRLALTLWRFWYMHGHLSEARRWLDSLLADGSGQPDLRAEALGVSGRLAFYLGDYGTTAAHCSEALALAQAHDWPRATADALTGLALLARNGHDLDGAWTLHEQALGYYRALGDGHSIVEALGYLSIVATWRHDHAGADRLLHEALALARRIGDLRGISFAVGLLGNNAYNRGDFAAARTFMVECFAIAEQLGERRLVGRASHRLGDIAFVHGEYAAAREHYERGARLHQSLGDRHYLALCLDGLAGVATQVGRPGIGARLLGAAAALRDQVGPTAERSYEPLYDEIVARNRAAQDDAAFAGAWNAGRFLTPDAALAEVRAALAPPTLAAPAPSAVSPPVANAAEILTTREVEVLRLVAQGLPDVQVAERLFVSARTVHAHLRTIYGKLGVPSRSAATRWAMERGLV